METQEYFKSLIGLTIEEAVKTLDHDPGHATLIEDEQKIFKLGKMPGRIRVALQRDRHLNVWKIVKVYGRG
jgi:hypothetical protein